MSRILKRVHLGFKALRELGPLQLSLYALYQLGLRSGHYRRVTPTPSQSAQPYSYRLHPVLNLPDPTQLADLLGETGLEMLQSEADEIVAGKVRLFGAQPVPLSLTPPTPLRYWTEYEVSSHQLGDPKFIWEPARFGWAFTLARAYWLTEDEQYPDAFWQHTEIFLHTNPPYLGPNWISGQEVAIRLCAMVFAAQVFAASVHSTPDRLSRLAQCVANHAARIPPTQVYARAQNNNHLITEALGLHTAAAALPDHPSASNWQRLGWRWLNHAFQHQFAADGTYCQHSSNYHRLALNAACWAYAVQVKCFPQVPFPPATLSRLQAGTSWLLALLDPLSGKLPNLGPNDGALIFPLAHSPFTDYRPALQTAARTFFGEPALPPGPWNEASLWLDLPVKDTRESIPSSRLSHPGQSVLHGADRSWAYLRSARFTSRPGHADQLHLDLWWQGLNLAQDPGTYRYTAAPPWDNALSSTLVHNTLSIDGQEQMTRAGRFLYLDWAHASPVKRTRSADGAWERLTTSHNGYRRLGVTHQRQVTAFKNRHWLVEDVLSGGYHRAHAARLHWLLPDLPWQADFTFQRLHLSLTTPAGMVELNIQAEIPLQTILVRAGELLQTHAVHQANEEYHPTWGWTSPSYGDKIPALALIVYFQGSLPLQITSEWILPDETS
jgi:hypothetical protein